MFVYVLQLTSRMGNLLPITILLFSHKRCQVSGKFFFFIIIYTLGRRKKETSHAIIFFFLFVFFGNNEVIKRDRTENKTFTVLKLNLFMNIWSRNKYWVGIFFLSSSSGHWFSWFFSLCFSIHSILINRRLLDWKKVFSFFSSFLAICSSEMIFFCIFILATKISYIFCPGYFAEKLLVKKLRRNFVWWNSNKAEKTSCFHFF